ncbi:MAG: hypothetical protein AAGL99_18665 [Pseudomonadota bacterium]
MKMLPINRGEGSRRQPLKLDKLTIEGFRRRLTAIADHYGECWVARDPSSRVIEILNTMFAEGLVIPIPRVAKQPKHLSRWQVTGKAVELYNEHPG